MSMRLATPAIRLDPVGLGTQSDLIGTPEPMDIASALSAPDGYLLACVIVLVAQGNRDRPRSVAEHPQSGAAAAVRLRSAVREPMLLHLPLYCAQASWRHK